jgi:hypothetical protein
MAGSVNEIEVYLEAGKRLTFAGALDWPGWQRRGRDESSALQALFDYRDRYARVLRPAGIDFQPPEAVAVFQVVERLEGDTATDFGSPGKIPTYDERPVEEAELSFLQGVMEACWEAFLEAVSSAQGHALRLGPRGGGRQLEAILDHVTGAQRAYLRRLGWKFKLNERADPQDEIARLRAAVLEGLAASAHGELPAKGPRGGIRWPARYFARRSAWHILDHAWEVEDRVER